MDHRCYKGEGALIAEKGKRQIEREGENERIRKREGERSAQRITQEHFPRAIG